MNIINETIKQLNNLDEQVLQEMALSRNEAIDKCIELGKQFTEHFNKLMFEGKNSDDYSHHVAEMQAWLDKVRNIKLKATNKYISNSQLSDWFFTAGQTVEDVIDFQYIDKYEKFYILILANPNMQLKEILEKFLQNKVNLSLNIC